MQKFWQALTIYIIMYLFPKVCKKNEKNNDQLIICNQIYQFCENSQCLFKTLKNLQIVNIKV